MVMEQTQKYSAENNYMLYCEGCIRLPQSDSIHQSTTGIQKPGSAVWSSKFSLRSVVIPQC